MDGQLGDSNPTFAAPAPEARLHALLVGGIELVEVGMPVEAAAAGRSEPALITYYFFRFGLLRNRD